MVLWCCSAEVSLIVNWLTRYRLCKLQHDTCDESVKASRSVIVLARSGDGAGVAREIRGPPSISESTEICTLSVLGRPTTLHGASCIEELTQCIPVLDNDCEMTGHSPDSKGE